MKQCPNCRTFCADDYAGMCVGCGKGLADVGVAGSRGEMNMHLAGLADAARREDRIERSAGQGGTSDHDLFHRYRDLLSSVEEQS